MTDVNLLFDYSNHVNEELGERLKRRVLQRIPELEYGRSYLLKTICGKAFWKSIPKNWDRSRAGCYIAHLVTIGELPLEFDGCPHRCPKRYRRK